MSLSPPSEDFDPRKYLRTLQRRWLVAVLTCIGTVALAGIAASRAKSSYEAVGQILIESDRKGSLTGVGERLGRVESLKREATPLDTQATVLQSSPLRREVIQVLNLKDADGKDLNPLDLEIEVEALPGTDIIQVSYRNGNSERSASVVNELMKAYMRQNRRISTGDAVVARGVVEKELPRAKRDLDQAAAALRIYRQERQIVALDKEANQLVDRQQQLADQIGQVATKLAAIQARRQAIDEQLGQVGQRDLRSVSLSQTPGVQSALTQLQQARSDLKVRQTRYRAGHPMVQEQQRKVTALEDSLQSRLGEVIPEPDQISAGQLQASSINQQLIVEAANLNQQQQGLEQQRSTLLTLQQQVSQRGQQIPNLVQDESGLLQNLRVAQNTYDSLRRRLSEIRLAEIQSITNARIIQPASPPMMASSKARNMLLMAGAGAGVCLGVAAAFMVDLLDRRLKTVDEIRALFPYHVLGLIPVTPAMGNGDAQPGAVTVVQDAPSIVHEAYRMLQANLQFLNPDQQPQTIVVSSAMAGEGKSVVSANLAATLAQSGQRVLLIDGDLRAPSQHHLWDLINRTGLSHWIVGSYSAESVVQPILPNLDVMTAGVQPPDSSTFLESDAFRSHLPSIAHRYDYILIDSPPLLDTADAVILSKMADGLLLVARPGVVDKCSSEAVRDLLHRSGCQILGLVVNAIDVKHDTAPMFHYNYERRRSSRPEVMRD